MIYVFHFPNSVDTLYMWKICRNMTEELENMKDCECVENTREYVENMKEYPLLDRLWDLE